MKHLFSLVAVLLLAAALYAGCAGDVPAGETTGTTADTTVTVPADTDFVFDAQIDFSDLP